MNKTKNRQLNESTIDAARKKILQCVSIVLLSDVINLQVRDQHFPFSADEKRFYY